MKKTLCAITAVLLLFSLAACRQVPFGNKKDIPQSTTATATTAKPVEITTEVKTEPVTEEVVLSAIKIETPPAKVKYFTGDTLDITGLVLSAEYSDGINETVTEGIGYSPEKLEKAGSQEITVTYGGKTATFTVEVQALAVTSVKLKSAPKKTTYYVGDFIDTTGLELAVAYNNGKSRTVKDGFEIKPNKAEKTGKQTINVSYGGKAAAFEVNAVESPVSSVAIISEPAKKSFYTGQEIDTTGLKLSVKYKNGKTDTITEGFILEQKSIKNSGVHKVNLSYKGKTVSYSVTVKNDAVSRIGILTEPDKLTYDVGDRLDTKGLSLQAIYLSGKKETITKDYSCSPDYFYSSGKIEVKVTYKKLQTSFTVIVREKTLSHITIRSNPNKTDYFVGNTLDTSGLTLTAHYSDNTTAVVTYGFSCSPTKLTSAGTTNITVTYKSKTTSFYVTVKEVALKYIKIINEPYKTRYKAGDYIDINGLYVAAVYTDGREEYVTTYDYSPRTVSPGENTVTVQYGGKTATFTVHSVVDIVEIYPTAVNAGKNFDNYMSVKVRYSDGTTADLFNDDFTVFPTVFNEGGTKTVTVTVGGVSENFQVKVNDWVENAYISRYPNKTVYKTGETLDTTGLEVIVIYHGGKEAKVTSGLKCSPDDFKYYDSGVYTVYVNCPDSYDSFYAGNFDITIT